MNVPTHRDTLRRAVQESSDPRANRLICSYFGVFGQAWQDHKLKEKGVLPFFVTTGRVFAARSIIRGLEGAVRVSRWDS
jgi:hypothetical protein